VLGNDKVRFALQQVVPQVCFFAAGNACTEQYNIERCLLQGL